MQTFSDITFGANDHPGIENCPDCGSADIACFGFTAERTDSDVTDVIECECGWSWERSGSIG